MDSAWGVALLDQGRLEPVAFADRTLAPRMHVVELNLQREAKRQEQEQEQQATDRELEGQRCQQIRRCVKLRST